MECLEGGGAASGGNVPDALAGGNRRGIERGGGLLEHAGLFECPDSQEPPLGGEHALDEHEFDGGLGAKFEEEGIGEFFGVRGGLIREEQRTGEEAVFERVAGGGEFAVRGFGATGFLAIGAGCGFLGVGAILGHSSTG